VQSLIDGKCVEFLAVFSSKRMYALFVSIVDDDLEVEEEEGLRAENLRDARMTAERLSAHASADRMPIRDGRVAPQENPEQMPGWDGDSEPRREQTPVSNVNQRRHEGTPAFDDDVSRREKMPNGSGKSEHYGKRMLS
jgi:hypothetical protein